MNSTAHRPNVLAALTALSCFLLALTAGSAAAATFQVNGTGDQPDATTADSTCETAAVTCTLRAAIETANESAGADTINFAASFDGGAGASIVLGSGLPAISGSETIVGDGSGRCATAAGFAGPCVAVAGVAGQPVLTVSGDDDAIEGLALTGGSVGISVTGAARGFSARNDWIGIDLSGTTRPNGAGILLGPSVGDVQIGGTIAAERNVVAGNSGDGLDIHGASDAVVAGNYFGVDPGGTIAVPNGTDIAVSSVPPYGPNASRNTIGGELTPAEAQTPACDGPCNVISGALGAGIELSESGTEDAAATGPTTIVGNYIGLNAAGTAAVANVGPGVRVGNAARVTIGGSTRALDGNHINGGAIGIASGPAEELLVVEGNMIGLDPAGSAMLAPPSEYGILGDGRGKFGGFEAARIAGNRISMTSGEAIRQRGSGATMVDNVIGQAVDGGPLPGAVTAIHLDLAASFASIVEDNMIANASRYGLLIENSGNRVMANRILSAGVAGIRIESPVGLAAAFNLIGEDAPRTEDIISDSGGAAIQIVGAETKPNHVARVSGSGNGSLFVDIGANGPGTEGRGWVTGLKGSVPIESNTPTIRVAKPTRIAGDNAFPTALIRVYGKAGASPGELKPLLAEDYADQQGTWSVNLPTPLSRGSFVAVAQTSDQRGSSEMAIAKIATATRTKIVRGPKRRSHRRTARFFFRSNKAHATFECRLDRRPFKRCHSPRVYKHLKPGKHIFRVRATDAAGDRDRSPALRKFTVLR